jgi:hypothetical protein
MFISVSLSIIFGLYYLLCLDVVFLYLRAPLGVPPLGRVSCIGFVFLVLIWRGCSRLNIFLGSVCTATYRKAHVLFGI